MNSNNHRLRALAILQTLVPTACVAQVTQVDVAGESSGTTDAGDPAGTDDDGDGATGATSDLPSSSSGGDSPTTSDAGSTSGDSTGVPQPCSPQVPSDRVILDIEPAFIGSFRDGGASGEVAHVLTTYEPSYGINPRSDVRFDLAGENVLVLTSYDATAWNIELGPNGQLAQVQVFSGSSATTVAAPDGVEVVFGDPNALLVPPACMPYDFDCYAESAADLVGATLGIPVASSDYSYSAQRFEYVLPGECGGVSDPPPQPCQDDVPGVNGVGVGECTAIEAEDAYCALVYTQQVDGGGGSGRVEYLGLDSGNTCFVTSTELGFTIGGVAWIGDTIYGIAHDPFDSNLYSGGAVDLTNGSMQLVGNPGPELQGIPSGVVATDAGFLVGFADTAYEYTDLDAFASNDFVATYDLQGFFDAATWGAIVGDVLHAMPWFGGPLQGWTWPADGAAPAVMGLECTNAPSLGFTAHGDEFLVAISPDRIRRYDVVTGDAIGDVSFAAPDGFGLVAIACRTGG